MPGGKHMLGMSKNRVFGTAKVGDQGTDRHPAGGPPVLWHLSRNTLLILGNEVSGLVVTKPQVLSDLADEILGTTEEDHGNCDHV